MIRSSMPLWPRAILNPCQLTSILLPASENPPGSKRGDWGVPLSADYRGETRVNPSFLAEGASNKTIARRLGISVHGQVPRRLAIDKLDAFGRTDAVAHAARLRVIHL